MSTTYTPTSNWTNRDIKGRDLQGKPLRPAESVSFSTDPATDRLSDRMAEDVRPQTERADSVQPFDDDFMNRPMVNASERDAVVEGPDVFDAPMVNHTSRGDQSDDAIFDAPMADRPAGAPERETVRASAASTISEDRSANARDDVISPTYGQGPRRRGVSPIMMIGAPLGVAAVAAVGWLALSGGEPTIPVAEPSPSLEIAGATPAADPLINMPVSETGAAVETAALAAPSSAPDVAARPPRTAPAQVEPVPTEAGPASAPAASIAPPEAAAISAEPAAEPDTTPETAAPLIVTEPLLPQ